MTYDANILTARSKPTRVALLTKTTGGSVSSCGVVANSYILVQNPITLPTYIPLRLISHRVYIKQTRPYTGKRQSQKTTLVVMGTSSPNGKSSHMLQDRPRAKVCDLHPASHGAHSDINSND